MSGNFRHNQGRFPRVWRSVEGMTAYFGSVIREQRKSQRDGLLHALMTAEIGNGMLSVLSHPDQLQELREDASLVPSAVEELWRYEIPGQPTARLVPEDTGMGGNRDSERFPDPDRHDITRQDNLHVAPARPEGQAAFETKLRRLPNLSVEPLRGLAALPHAFGERLHPTADPARERSIATQTDVPAGEVVRS